ncbi:MAG: hypothetical protein ACSLFP_07035 [Acidimicrobiales bacterium]
MTVADAPAHGGPAAAGKIGVVRSTLALVVVVAALLVGGAAPAAADPAGPSDYRSVVTGIEPSVEGVSPSIVGGDSFLELTVDEGLELIVLGYTGEPYLRFRADGTVDRNRLSPATYLNEDRSAAAPIPPDVVAANAGDDVPGPEWEEVATGGSYAWHDHRVHWMSESAPPVERGEQVGGEYDPWRVPLVIDGETVEVVGTLTYEEATSPVLWALVGVAGAALVVLLGRLDAVRAAATALAVVASAAVVVGRAEWATTPDGSGNPLLFALPAVALLAAVAALVLARRGAAVVLALASVATLSGWALLRLQALTKPVLPSDLPAGFDRATVALALGASVAAAYLAVTSGALALPDLDDDEEPGG